MYTRLVDPASPIVNASVLNDEVRYHVAGSCYFLACISGIESERRAALFMEKSTYSRVQPLVFSLDLEASLCVFVILSMLLYPGL